MKNTELNSICNDVFEANKKKGFDVSTSNMGQTLMLVVSELVEALEADRKNRICAVQMGAVNGWAQDDDFKSYFETNVKDTFEDEIADSFIRLMDLVGGLGIDIDSHISAKRRYNSLREYKHGGKAY